MANYDNPMRSTYVPGMDDFYAPALSPEVISPEPQRYATGIVVVGLNEPSSHHFEGRLNVPPPLLLLDELR
jgi:hypothetical protein